ncbi:hypothetical protein GF382_01825 [Candidatus Falkowbacteria bacterium]|nr:hypothetical protein [Candidatus Falkowbacteria bacterium]
MTLKSYLILMSIATIMCWGAFAFVINAVDPTETNRIGFLLFYSSLGLALAGSFSIFGFLIRFKILKRALVFRQVAEAFRQSFLMSLMVIAILMLLSRDMLTWLNLFLLAAGISLLEYFWVSRERGKAIRHRN